MADQKDNPLNKLLDNPMVYVGGSALALLGSFMGWFDSTFLLLILPAAGYGLFRWYQNKKA